MKKINLLILSLFLLFMVGCGRPEPEEDIIVPIEYLFVGENESWKGEYQVTGSRTFDGEDPSEFKGLFEYILTATYKGKGEDLADVKRLEILVKSELKESRYRQDFPQDGRMETSYAITYRSQGLNILEDETIHVTITMDDKTEKLELTSK